MKATATDWETLAHALARMARDLLAQDSVGRTLERITAHAVELVDGCEAAGILVVRAGQVDTVAATDNVVRASDRIQGELGEGPCFDASYDRTQVNRIPDISVATRWPRYAPQARELGIGSMMGFLLFTHDDTDLGALNLYSSRPGAFTEDSEHVGWVLASHAAVALANAHHHEHLQHALVTRRNIGEATGILMARHDLTEHEAFARMVTASQHSNIKLRDLADTINTTGDLPQAAH